MRSKFLPSDRATEDIKSTRINIREGTEDDIQEITAMLHAFNEVPAGDTSRDTELLAEAKHILTPSQGQRVYLAINAMGRPVGVEHIVASGLNGDHFHHHALYKAGCRGRGWATRADGGRRKLDQTTGKTRDSPLCQRPGKKMSGRCMNIVDIQFTSANLPLPRKIMHSTLPYRCINCCCLRSEKNAVIKKAASQTITVILSVAKNLPVL